MLLPGIRPSGGLRTSWGGHHIAKERVLTTGVLQVGTARDVEFDLPTDAIQNIFHR